ncbi:MAG: hypothetical protein J6A37_13575 [Oscillospiraceae bacterium]|nr:hypothetical protein [Oscillospiraceae bacterium]
MGFFKNCSHSDRKQIILLFLWFLSGGGMIAAGVYALIHREEAIGRISGFLGICAIATAVITLVLRIGQVKRLGKRNIGLDILIWFLLGFLLLNTDIFNRLGKLAFVIWGIVLICEGIRAFFACQRNREEKGWYIPRMIFSAVFVMLGIINITNAQELFTHLTAFAVGVYFIIHGTELLYEWIGRVKHFYNFRGTE